MNSLSSTLRLAIAAGIATASCLALAQTSPTPSGSLAPAGQGPGVHTSSPETSGMSTKSRATVKAQTRKAEASGQLQQAGEAATPIGGATTTPMTGEQSTGATNSRPHRPTVKRQTQAAERSGTLQPAGEAPQPSSEMPKK